MKVHARTAAIWLLMQFSMNGCGLGTEVGNGVKPENEEGSSKKTAASDNAPAEQGDAENSDKMETPTANSAEQPTPGTYDFDVNILLNSCGSPFESVYNGQIALSGLNASGKNNLITGDYNTVTGSWVINDTFGKFLATISNDNTVDDYKVDVVDIDQKTIEPGYVCAQQAGSNENDIYTYNFELTKNGKKSLLSWKVDTSETEEKLISISIKPDAAQITVIKLEAIKN